MTSWSLSGGRHTLEDEGERWLAALPPKEWPHEGLDLHRLRDSWTPLWGDRRQQVRPAGGKGESEEPSSMARAHHGS